MHNRASRQRGLLMTMTALKYPVPAFQIREFFTAAFRTDIPFQFSKAYVLYCGLLFKADKLIMILLAFSASARDYPRSRKRLCQVFTVDTRHLNVNRFCAL